MYTSVQLAYTKGVARESFIYAHIHGNRDQIKISHISFTFEGCPGPLSRQLGHPQQAALLPSLSID